MSFVTSSRLFNKYVLALVLFPIFFLLAFQGFDVTDWGFHFTNQYLLLEYPLSSIHINPMYILSDAAGGLWLHLLGMPSVFWGKLGGAILFSFCAFIVASILEDYFPQREVFFCVLTCSIFLTAYISQYINYFTFPALLTLIFFWVFNKLMSVPGNSRDFAAYAFTLGFLLVPIILSRFTLIVMILFLPLLAFYYWWTGHPLDNFSRGVRYAAAGVIVSTGLVACIFHRFGILEVYIDIIRQQILYSATDSEVYASYTYKHSMPMLFRLYLSEYIRTLIGVFVFIGGIFTIGRLKEKINQHWITLGLAIATISGLIFGLATHIRGFNFALSYMPRVFIGIVILFALLFLYHHERSDKNLALLLIVSGVVMIINPLGSDSGILKSIHAFWLALPLAMLCMYRLGRQTENKFAQTTSSLIPTILLLLLIIGIFMQGGNVYRDDPNRLNLTTPFQNPQLFGTYSTPERVQVTDELISIIERETEPGDYVLMVNSMSMFYYLTETRPALGQPWLFLFSEEAIVDLEEERVRTGEIQPKLFIYPKVNTRDRYWPGGDTPLKETDEAKLDYLKGQYIDTYQYPYLWENDAFAVYRIPLDE
ncbi:MAG: hypothetical protein WC993_02565 [Methanoculleus sp.]